MTVRKIPFEEAEAILERHKRALINIPGVNSVGMDLRGFLIGVDPDIPVHLPKEIEELPVNTFPMKPAEGLSHTSTTPIRPIHGGVAVRPVEGFVVDAITIRNVLGFDVWYGKQTSPLPTVCR